MASAIIEGREGRMGAAAAVVEEDDVVAAVFAGLLEDELVADGAGALGAEDFRGVGRAAPRGVGAGRAGAGD